jgi:outer membrane protein assembly factor BamB
MVTHREAWRTQAGGTMRMAVVGQTVLTAGADTKARCLDLATGTVKWVSGTGSSPLGIGTCGANFYVSAFQLRRFDSGSGQLTGEAGTGRAEGGFVSHVASDGSRIFVSGTSGVAAFRC